jgi:hypothetical protein
MNFRPSLAIALVVLGGIASAGTEPDPRPAVDAALTVRLTAGKSTYAMGEIIPLELEFRGRAGPDYYFSTATGDRLGGGRERYEVAPAGGSDDPMAEFLSSVGIVGSIPSGWHPLDGSPFVVRVHLNEWVRFTKPGSYRLSIESTRLDRYSREPAPTLTSSPLTLRIETPTPEWAAAEVGRAVAALEGRGPGTAREGAAILRHLGTKDAAIALASHYGVGGDAREATPISPGSVTRPSVAPPRGPCARPLAGDRRDPDRRPRHRPRDADPAPRRVRPGPRPGPAGALSSRPHRGGSGGDDGADRPVRLEHDPSPALRRLQPGFDRRRSGMCVVPPWSEIASSHWDQAVEAAAIAHLQGESPRLVSDAAQILGAHGSARAKGPLLERLARWNEEWRSRAAELAGLVAGPASLDSPVVLENALVNALLDGRGFSLKREETERVRELCLTTACRDNVDARARSRPAR